MKNMTKTLAISSAIATGVMMATSSEVYAGKKEYEKCYGVAKAGKNDCGTSSGLSCAGTSTKDAQKDAWMYLPKGMCERIVGGTLKPKK